LTGLQTVADGEKSHLEGRHLSMISRILVEIPSILLALIEGNIAQHLTSSEEGWPNES
jgi:hypothetical protein